MEDSRVALRPAQSEFEEGPGFAVEATYPHSAILPEGQVQRMATVR